MRIFHFVLKKVVVQALLIVIIGFQVKAQNAEKFFPAKDLTSVGVYYYPEHWDSTQWERDFRNMAKWVFKLPILAKLPWLRSNLQKAKMISNGLIRPCHWPISTS